MFITHAIIGSAGSALLLLAALGLLAGVVVLAVSTRARRARRRDVPDAVPLWWDQAPAAGAPAGTTATSTHA
jgi:hypothetical protein